MSFPVLLTADAARDLEDIYQYVAIHDAPGKADNLLTNIEKIFSRLSEFPERGVYPKELSALGIREYREIVFKPYRLIYRFLDDKVYVLLVECQDIVDKKSAKTSWTKFFDNRIAITSFHGHLKQFGGVHERRGHAAKDIGC